jgi:CheY-like chemotaxis protein/anti-sigma regulatory factor (Ser/Thr protein kinase)
MIRLLAVDDEPINLAIIAECLSEDGYQLDEAGDGEEAWALMLEKRYDLLVLDRMMPRLDGLSLLKRIKADARWSGMPVIMQTAAATQQEVREGLEAGAYYYLTKPYEPEALRALVNTVIADLAERDRLREASSHMQTTISLLDHGEFSFRTIEEARGLAAALANLCRDGNTSAMGLVELLVNAVEHGNLAITYAEKSQLRQSYGWEDEVARRLTVEPYCHRRGRIALRRDGQEIEFTVTDQGAGFDWKPYLALDPDRAYDLNGRGIAMAKMLGFTSLEYQGAGNVVVARVAALGAVSG